MAFGVVGALMLSSGCGRVGVEMLDAEQGLRDPAGREDAGRPDGAVPVIRPVADASARDAVVGDAGVDIDASDDIDASVDSDAAVDSGATTDSGADVEVDAGSGVPVEVDAGSGVPVEVDAGSGVPVEVDAGSGLPVELDAGPDASEPEVVVDAGPQPCDFSGTWVGKLTGAASWSGGIALASGSGTTHVWSKFEMTASGELVPGSMAICGMTMPSFAITPLMGNERYAMDLNVPLFDAEPPVALAIGGSIQVGAGFPGDDASLSDTAVVLGTTLNDPFHDAWPAVNKIVSNDLDGDGKPGVTFNHVNDANHKYMRLDMFGSARADRGYYASRVVFRTQGKVVSCDEMAGQAVVSRFDTHVIGCHVVGGGDCNTTQRDNLDSWRPIMQINSATYRAIKVGDHATCQMAREAL
jgi:hypothetical protein